MEETRTQMIGGESVKIRVLDVANQKLESWLIQLYIGGVQALRGFLLLASFLVVHNDFALILMGKRQHTSLHICKNPNLKQSL